MRICVLVKEVPDATVRKRLHPDTGRLERSGERTLNPHDAHAIEAAVRLRESAPPPVEEIIAVTMGPTSASRVLHKAVSLGADRSVHLCDEAFAGADLLATGYVLAKALEREAPDLVLLGQQSDDGECCALAAVVGEFLRMPTLTQVVGLELVAGALRCRRQAEYGYDTIELAPPAVIAVGDALNEPRYPALKAIMDARGRPLETLGARDLDLRADEVGAAGSGARWSAAKDPPGRTRGVVIDDRDSDQTVAQILDWLEQRRLA
jgi:electron transfer flavoprotein beta subunit